VTVWRKRRKLRRQSQSGFHYTAAAPAALEVAERFERLLARRRMPCPASVTWHEHLAMLAAADTSIRKGVELRRCVEFARRFNAIRFGGDKSYGELAALKQELDAIEKLP
jgi:hypothetical protein